jgi:mono/diheme cytochrome c family protein
MAGGHGGDPSGAIKLYVGIFLALTAVTVFEMLPLFGLMELPGSILIGLSVLKFLVVCYFFMHLLGDHPIYQRLFFIPLVMVTLSVMVLMSLAGSWNLNYRKAPRLKPSEVAALTDEQRGEMCLTRVGVKNCCPTPAEGESFSGDTCSLVSGKDTSAMASRYRGVWEGECNAWAKSSATGNEFCASPGVELDLSAAYAAVKEAASAKDPRFDGFDAKSDDEKLVLLKSVGEEVYLTNCSACHQATGLGLAGVFPPLKNDPLIRTGTPEDHINVILKGMSGVTIDGVAYAAAMAPWAQLSDEQIAAAATYERKAWGNDASVILPAQVAALR